MDKLLKNIRKILQFQEVKTCGFIFRAHSSFTTAILLTFSLVITAKEYVGSPIECITQHQPESFINTYCWIQSTYTMPNAYLQQVGKNIPHHGIANDNGEEGKYHNYYQWVCFALFGQAALCYLPKVIWDYFEGGFLRLLVEGLKDSLIREEERNKKTKIITDFLIKNRTMHNKYVITYWICELLCLCNIFLQMFFMNWFLDGEFISYGWKVLILSLENQEERVDPMIYVFPRLTKCVFKKFGPSGNIQHFDNLCILPLNIINEKTYIFIWFWFFILFCLLITLLASRVLLFTSVSLRATFLFSYTKIVSRNKTELISANLSIGNWWILCMLRDNLNLVIFRDIISEIVKDIEENLKPGNVRENLYIAQLELGGPHLYPTL